MNRRTALSRVVVIIITHEAVQCSHQVVVNALQRFVYKSRSDDPLA